MASSRVPTRVPHRRARCPLRCADRSSLRSYRSAPTSAVTSASISPCTKCRTASRRKSPSGNSPLRRTSNKLMLSSATASLLSKLCLTALRMHAVAAFVTPGCPPDLHHVLGRYTRLPADPDETEMAPRSVAGGRNLAWTVAWTSPVPRPRDRSTPGGDVVEGPVGGIQEQTLINPEEERGLSPRAAARRESKRMSHRPLTRSEHMTRVKPKNSLAERALRSALHAAGLRFRLHRRVEGVTVDIVFPGPRVGIFVDGCFWHGCPEHAT